MLSMDLVEYIAASPPLSERPWYEEIEDHDIGMRIMMDYPEPVSALPSHFWAHGIKYMREFQMLLEEESNRLQNNEQTLPYL